MFKKSLYLIGYSGHAYVVIEAINKKKYQIDGYFDFQEVLSNPYNIFYAGYEKDGSFMSIVGNAYVFPSIGDNAIRERLISYLKEKEIQQINIIAQSAILSLTVQLGKSVFISAGAIINAQVKIGDGCIINTGVVIEHECQIGSYSHIAPGTVLAGNVKVGNNVFIGANATIKQGVRIGDNVIVGAGTVVLGEIAAGKIIIGNPGREI